MSEASAAHPHAPARVHRTRRASPLTLAPRSVLASPSSGHRASSRVTQRYVAHASPRGREEKAQAVAPLSSSLSSSRFSIFDYRPQVPPPPPLRTPHSASVTPPLPLSDSRARRCFRRLLLFALRNRPRRPRRSLGLGLGPPRLRLSIMVTARSWRGPTQASLVSPLASAAAQLGAAVDVPYHIPAQAQARGSDGRTSRFQCFSNSEFYFAPRRVVSTC